MSRAMVALACQKRAFGQLLERLGKIAALGSESAPTGVQAPNSTAVSLTSYLLANLREAGLLPDRVIPSTKGGIALVFLEGQSAGRYADLECFNNGQVVGSMLDREHITCSLLISVQHSEGISVSEAIQKVRNFLRG